MGLIGLSIALVCARTVHAFDIMADGAFGASVLQSLILFTNSSRWWHLVTFIPNTVCTSFGFSARCQVSHSCADCSCMPVGLIEAAACCADQA